jgi:hypothetical protein
MSDYYNLDEKTVKNWKENAQLAIKHAKNSGFDIKIDSNSLKDIDTILEEYHRNRGSLTKQQIEKLIFMFFGLFGEILIKDFGGKWVLQENKDSEDKYAVLIGKEDEEKQDIVLVQDKVEKRIKDGEEDSLEYFYKVIKSKHNKEPGQNIFY